MYIHFREARFLDSRILKPTIVFFNKIYSNPLQCEVQRLRSCLSISFKQRRPNIKYSLRHIGFICNNIINASRLPHSSVTLEIARHFDQRKHALNGVF